MSFLVLFIYLVCIILFLQCLLSYFQNCRSKILLYLVIMDQKQIQKQQKNQNQKTNTKFSKVFCEENNSSCFQCGRYGDEWVQTRHMIFLCLNCAAKFTEIPRVVNIKSIAADFLTEQEFEMIKIGGNTKFKQFIMKYDLHQESPFTILTSKAAQFYRLYLLNPTKLSLKDAPSYIQGRTPIMEMANNEILQQNKLKLPNAGQKTMYYGTKAYEKLSNTIKPDHCIENAQIAAQKVSETAKTIWSFVSTKINQIHNKENQGFNY